MVRIGCGFFYFNRCISSSFGSGTLGVLSALAYSVDVLLLSLLLCDYFFNLPNLDINS